jgi:V/A-type H+-transporting ATPase subunit I
MGVTKLNKVALYYHKSVREDVAKVLHYSGACQIIEDAGAEETGVRVADVEERLRECEEQETHIRYLFRSLGGHYVDPVPSLDRMWGKKPLLSLAELAQTAQKTDLKELASSVKKTEAALNELRIEATQLKANAEILSKIQDFPYPLSILGEGTRTLKGVLGTLSAEHLEILKGDLATYAGETELFVAARRPKDKEVWAVLMFARTHEQQILELCAKDGVALVEVPPHISGTAAEETAKITAELSENASKDTQIVESMGRTAEKWMPVVQNLSDYWAILHDRYRALAASDATDSTVRTCFWISAEVLPLLQKQVEAVASSVAFDVSDPTKEDSPPTILRNNAFATPAETLTNLFSPPIYGRRDPTGPMAPFFFLFFGMCLGDAGYALVIAGFLLILFKKYPKIPADIKTFMRLFLGSAVATFLYGIFTGSFFGDFIDKFPFFPFVAFLRPVKDMLLIVDPLKNPMIILAVSLLLGIIHLMFGLAIAAYDEFRDGNVVDAVGGKISWIFLVVGLVIGVASSGILHSAGLYMAALGACLIFWYAGRGTKNIFLKIGSGLYALYGSSGYLGDILSYSRLLALGLGSAVIGSVINMFGVMIAGVPYIGWALAAIVVIGGHVFSLAINLLGAFVHSMRLQFVEFFGKFYSGDGISFKPLRFHTQYVDVVDKR